MKGFQGLVPFLDPKNTMRLSFLGILERVMASATSHINVKSEFCQKGHPSCPLPILLNMGLARQQASTKRWDSVNIYFSKMVASLNPGVLFGWFL